LTPGISIDQSNKPPLAVSDFKYKLTFFTMGEAPRSGIRSTVDKNNSRPLRRFSKKEGRNLASWFSFFEFWNCTDNGFWRKGGNQVLMSWKGLA
jgi:hypothetical protein